MKEIYFLLLAILIGVEIALGALVAPVVFYPQGIIGDGVLTLFQSGQMMAVIFVKFNYILLFVSIFAFIYEIFTLRSQVVFGVKLSTFMLCGINLILSIAFVFYFTPYILDAQKLGEEATKTAEFMQIHKASEWVMKLMMISQIILWFIKFRSDIKK
ncbi:MAG: DUF4149 domain-containing protein [Campylobacter sp.]